MKAGTKVGLGLGGALGIAVAAVLLVLTALSSLLASSAPDVVADRCGTTAVQPGEGSPEGDLTAVQVAHVRTILAVGQSKGITPYGWQVALAVARQESTFLNYANDGLGSDLRPDQFDVSRSLAYPHDAVGTDHGSVNVFQQQYPWWGTLDVLMDPVQAAGLFYDALLQVPGWQDMEVTVAAQSVQRSAFPMAYADDADVALRLIEQYAAGSTVDGPVEPCPTPDGARLPDGTVCPPRPDAASVEANLKPNAVTVLRCIHMTFGDDPKFGAQGGFRAYTASNPGSDHGRGLAVDNMILDYKSAAGIALGDAMAAFVQANATQFGVTYIIWNARIWSPERAVEGWRPYDHPSGGANDTLRHLDHVHVSVSPLLPAGGFTP